MISAGSIFAVAMACMFFGVRGKKSEGVDQELPLSVFDRGKNDEGLESIPNELTF